MRADTKNNKAYFIGGGIASLAGAVYLIKDGGFQGKNITILEANSAIGGSLDAKRNYSGKAYIMTGHRILAKNAFECTYALLSRVPSLENKNLSVKDQIDNYNLRIKTFAKARLVENGQIINSHTLGLCWRDRWNLSKVLMRREATLDNLRIDEYFDATFFETNFWSEFSTVFAFQPWHSLAEFRRYIFRSFHALPFYDTMECIQNTPYNQHDSLVLPIMKWLEGQGVNFKKETIVTGLAMEIAKKEKAVKKILFTKNKKKRGILIGEEDIVFATLGSMTTNASFGSMHAAPKLKKRRNCAAWNFWEKISILDPDFGRPKVFDNHAKKSKWESFTVTFRNKTFFALMKKLTGNIEGTGGGTTFHASNWGMSITIPHQPHFRGQSKGVDVCWGYSLRPDKKGNFVKKEMYECTGEEILIELIGHLGFEKQKDKIIGSATCIPCVMPYITSQFSPRSKKDRPRVVPTGAKNFAFLGQFCEIPDDIVFTVEYSIRSAQIAVYSLLGLDKKIDPILKGYRHPGNIFRAIKTILR
ncbi:MAG: oleate hydratase [Parcubacteria group bacterium]|jgi:oleate hydratase